VATVRTDDRIQAVQGRWIESRGMVLPFFLTYVTWGVFLGVAFAAYLLWTLLGAAPKNAVSWGVLLGVLAAMWATAQMSSDRGLLGVLTIKWAEIRYWLSERRTAVRDKAERKPVTLTGRRVRR
jgi:hypothetical protein